MECELQIDLWIVGTTDSFVSRECGREVDIWENYGRVIREGNITAGVAATAAVFA